MPIELQVPLGTVVPNVLLLILVQQLHVDASLETGAAS